MVIPKTVNMLRSILAQAPADDCELLLTKSDTSLTRFAGSAIHQSSQTEERCLRIRVVVDGRAGVFETGRFDHESVLLAVQKAAEIARLQPAPARPIQLPSAAPIADSSAYDEQTARSTPFDRAEVIRSMCGIAGDAGCELAGALTTAEEKLCVVNTKGVESFQEYTFTRLNLTAQHGSRSGYAFWAGHRLGALPHEALVTEAASHASFPGRDVLLEPGAYTVILDHHAVGELLGFLAYLGFGAKNFLEGRSFLTTAIGQKLFSDKVSIWDDAMDHTSLVRPFDYEGVPKKRTLLVENGTARTMVTDSATSPLLEVENTGHALPAPNTDGPHALHLHMAPGDTSLADIIAGTRRGIFVRRFHYVNVVEPMSAVLTGMTRDGTFLVENGKIRRPVRSLRFTESLLRALKNVQKVSEETRLVEGVLGMVKCPALKIRGFHFTGSSDQ